MVLLSCTQMFIAFLENYDKCEICTIKEIGEACQFYIVFFR